MMGDYHVRFCERLGVKFPLPTRLKNKIDTACGQEHRQIIMIHLDKTYH